MKTEVSIDMLGGEAVDAVTELYSTTTVSGHVEISTGSDSAELEADIEVDVDDIYYEVLHNLSSISYEVNIDDFLLRLATAFVKQELDGDFAELAATALAKAKARLAA